MTKEYRKVTEFKTVENFAAYIAEQGYHIGFAPDGKHDALAQTAECLGMTLGNRWAILPMEGWDCLPDGSPSDLTMRRWLRFATSGAKLIYGTEAAAVMHSGRSNPRQLMAAPHTREALSAMVQKMRFAHRERFGRDDDLAIGLQLTHSGRYSHPNADDKLESVTAYAHPLLDQKFGNSAANVVRDEDVGDIVQHFVTAAQVAYEAGFQFVDIKHAHGYLTHEFLTAYDRKGKYGGSFENRTRFCREILEGIRKKVPALKLSARLSIFDIMPFIKGQDGMGKPMDWQGDYPYAFGGDGTGLGMDPDLGEVSRFVDLLKSYGVDLICGTIGSPYYSVHMQRPAYYPVCDGYAIPERGTSSCGGKAVEGTAPGHQSGGIRADLSAGISAPCGGICRGTWLGGFRGDRAYGPLLPRDMRRCDGRETVGPQTYLPYFRRLHQCPAERNDLRLFPAG